MKLRACARCGKKQSLRSILLGQSVPTGWVEEVAAEGGDSVKYRCSSCDEKVRSDEQARRVWSVQQDVYGAEYQSHLLEQYKFYVEMADRISSRRGIANNFLLSVNALLASVFGALASTTTASSQAWLFALLGAGLIVCVVWYVLIRSYRQLNTVKFRAILEIEGRLPVAPYASEGDAYLPLTSVERFVPGVFGLLYLALAGAVMYEVVT